MTKYIIVLEVDRNLPALFPRFSYFCEYIDKEEDE